MPTTDLMSRWPVAFFTWALLIVGLVSVAAAYWYTSAFAPAPISKAHAATQFSLVPAIATTPNAGSCTNVSFVDEQHGAALCFVSQHRSVCGDDDQATRGCGDRLC